jgi:hypothetical protein
MIQKVERGQRSSLLTRGLTWAYNALTTTQEGGALCVSRKFFSSVSWGFCRVGFWACVGLGRQFRCVRVGLSARAGEGGCLRHPA